MQLSAFARSKAVDQLLAFEIPLARNRILNFVLYTYPEYVVKQFHRLICRQLDALYDGRIKKLMIFIPPQHGKTELVSRRFPAYALGRDPDRRVVVCSYAADLASKINRQVQRIIETPEYARLFPESKLNTRNVVADSRQSFLRNADEFEIVNHTGGLKTVGVGGPLTGNPVDIGIIDDPIKDAVEGQSAIDRNRKWEWYNEVFCTRLHNESRQLLTMTRWHQDDLSGRILAHEEGQWVIINLPYIKEGMPVDDDPRVEGEALWPEKHSAAKAAQMKSNSERTYAALCQQRPAPQEGGLFKRNWFKTYSATGRPPRFDTIVQSWDCTFKDAATSDFVVGQVWGKIDANAYLLGMVRGRWSFTETVKQMLLLNETYPECDAKYVEDKANGTAVIDTLKAQIPGIIPVSPTESKESRAAAVSYVVEAGNVYLPDDEPWFTDLMEEFAVFPNGKHDDMVDSMTQALAKLYKGSMTPGMFIIA